MNTKRAWNGVETYNESAHGLPITLLRALREVLRNDCDPVEFLADNGHHQTYLAHEVVEWLGY